MSRRITLAATLLAVVVLSMGTARRDGQDLSGTLVVVNKGPGTATIVDVATGNRLATLPTGQGPHEVAMTSDGATAIVTDYGPRADGSTLTVIDVPGLRVARTISMGGHTGAHGIAVMPGDRRVAVTSERSGHVVIVQIADGEILEEIPTGHPGSHMLAMVADGRMIYTSNGGDGTVSRLDRATGGPTATFDVPPRPEAIGVTPDGAEVWVGSNERGTVSAIDPATGDVEEALAGFGWPYRVLFTPDARRVLLPDLGRHQLRIVDRASRGELAVLDFPDAGPQGITLSPDARWAFQSLSQEARVVIIDLESREVVRSLSVGQTPDGVAFTTRTVSGSAH